MEDLSQDWDSGSDMAESPSPSISSQTSMITSNGTKKAINRGRWTKEEVKFSKSELIRERFNAIDKNLQDEKLRRLVEIHGERWDFIASHFPDRADVQCQHRWSKVVNPELVKGKTIADYLEIININEEKLCWCLQLISNVPV